MYVHVHVYKINTINNSINNNRIWHSKSDDHSKKHAWIIIMDKMDNSQMVNYFIYFYNLFIIIIIIIIKLLWSCSTIVRYELIVLWQWRMMPNECFN